MPVQSSVFGDEHSKKIVNVASVKQLSPFRYPGGKTWLVPSVRQWLSNKKKSKEFIETFAGGGIISLSVAHEGLSEHVTMIELDPDVAAVWHTIFSDDAEWLAEMILGFDLTPDNVNEAIQKEALDVKERALQTILKNRTFHGGILAPGSGLLKHGENGKGIASRWYPETLAKRIRYIQTFKERISFVEGDGLDYMQKNAHRSDVTFFADPPYTAPGKRAGSRLYRYFQLEHERLFDIAATVKGDFMLTYDNAQSVQDMADARGFRVSRVPMKGTHHNAMFELLITPA